MGSVKEILFGQPGPWQEFAKRESTMSLDVVQRGRTGDEGIVYADMPEYLYGSIASKSWANSLSYFGPFG